MSAELTPNQEKWVAALESGKYAQAVGELHNDDGFCCLGVACVVAHADGVPLNVLSEGAYVSYDGWTSTLPPAVQDWLGIDTDSPTIGTNHAIDLNDSDGLSFSEIAARIRAFGVR